jgi:hypothetical protein
MKHIDSGFRCLVGHGDGYGQCLECSVCKKWIRPQDWNKECLGYIPIKCGYCDNTTSSWLFTTITKKNGIGTKINCCENCIPKQKAGEEPIRKETWEYKEKKCSTCGNVIEGLFYWGYKDGKYYRTCKTCGMPDEDKIKFEVGELVSVMGEGAKKRNI